MNKYQIDDYLLMLLGPLYSEPKKKRITEIFNTLYNYNLIFGNIYAVSLPALEQNLVDQIVSNETAMDTLSLTIEQFLKEYLILYVRKFGIYLNNEIELYSTHEFLVAFYELLTLDPNLLEPIYIAMETAEHYDSDTTLLATILSERTDLPVSEYLNMIEDVNEDLFQRIKLFLVSRLDVKTAELSADTVKIIELFKTADQSFIETNIVKNIIAYGYMDRTIDFYLNDLYAMIQQYKNNLILSAYEIVATFYIATDTNADIVEQIKEKINFESILFLNEKPETIDLLFALISDLVLKLKRRS